MHHADSVCPHDRSGAASRGRRHLPQVLRTAGLYRDGDDPTLTIGQLCWSWGFNPGILLMLLQSANVPPKEAPPLDISPFLAMPLPAFVTHIEEVYHAGLRVQLPRLRTLTTDAAALVARRRAPPGAAGRTGAAGRGTRCSPAARGRSTIPHDPGTGRRHPRCHPLRQRSRWPHRLHGERSRNCRALTAPVAGPDGWLYGARRRWRDCCSSSGSSTGNFGSTCTRKTRHCFRAPSRHRKAPVDSLSPSPPDAGPGLPRFRTHARRRPPGARPDAGAADGACPAL